MARTPARRPHHAGRSAGHRAPAEKWSGTLSRPAFHPRLGPAPPGWLSAPAADGGYLATGPLYGQLHASDPPTRLAGTGRHPTPLRTAGGGPRRPAVATKSRAPPGPAPPGRRRGLSHPSSQDVRRHSTRHQHLLLDTRPRPLAAFGPSGAAPREERRALRGFAVARRLEVGKGRG